MHPLHQRPEATRQQAHVRQLLSTMTDEDVQMCKRILTHLRLYCLEVEEEAWRDSPHSTRWASALNILRQRLRDDLATAPRCRGTRSQSVEGPASDIGSTHRPEADA
jgi:hypothetical protein